MVAAYASKNLTFTLKFYKVYILKMKL